MTEPAANPGHHVARTAVEALRAGVPNRAAIRLLGSVETGIESRFVAGLDAAWSNAPRPGLIFTGGFGSGKSHLLGYLREEALNRNFVVSYVTISKETPLASPGLVFAAAMRGAVAPSSHEDAISVALSRLERRPGAAQELEAWLAEPAQAGLSQLFSAVAHLLARPLPQELRHGIEAFLCGGKPPTAAVRNKLAQLGARGLFDLTGAKAAALALQRPRFMTRLFQHAGFAGWCLLIDEVELIGRYGPLQRALAYAELAIWLGFAPDRRLPGLHTVCAISDDFADVVINARQDDEKLPERLRNRGSHQAADLAVKALAAIRHASTHAALRPPDDADLRRREATLRGCYTMAYGWVAPMAAILPRENTRTMRHHIRGWVTEWDMLRLGGTRAGIEVTALAADYTENADLETPAVDDSAG